MRKVLIILSFLLVTIGYSQVLEVDMLNRNEMTTAQMNAITVAQGLVSGSEILNTDTDTIWRYNGTIWENTGGGGGSSYAFTSPLVDNTGTVSLNMAAFDFTQILTTYPNLDIDSTNDFSGDYVDLINKPTITGNAGVVAEGSVDASNLPSSSNTLTVSHNLGYVPEAYRIFAFNYLPNGSTAITRDVSLSNITSTTFDLIVEGNTTAQPYEVVWSIFGTDTATPLNGTEVVSLINTELGQTTWQSGGADDQTALEVPFTPTGNTASTNVQAAIEEVQTELDGVAAGGISTVNQSRIDNAKKFDPNIKSGGSAHTLSADDFVLTSSGNEGTRSGIGVTDGSTQTVNWTDVVITANSEYPLPVPAYNGTVINNLESGSTYTFSDYGGGATGDIWTVTDIGAVATIQGSTIYVSGGTVSTSAPAAIYQGANAADPANEQNNTNNIDVTNGDFTVAVVGSPTTDGAFALEFTRVKASGTAAEAFIELPGTADATAYIISLDTQETVGTVFDVGLQIARGWTSDENITVSGTMTTINFASNTTTSAAAVIRVRSFGAGNVGDKIVIDNLVIQ